MAYELGIAGAPETVPPGSGVLVVHPETVDADEVETSFLTDNDDPVLVVSTHSAAREVSQKLDHYGIDRDRVEILDAISIERGYTRRQRDDVTYLRAPDDLEGIRSHVAEFLARHDGRARVTVDSITELIYFADADRGTEAVAALLDLLAEHDAVGLFHVTGDVREESLEDVESEFYGVAALGEDATVHDWHS